MAARTLYRSVTCNVLMFDPVSQRLSTIREAWGQADVLKLQEAIRDGGNIRKLKGAKWYQAPGSQQNNPIIWRDSKFKLINKGAKTFYEGNDGWGPGRGFTWVLLEDRATTRRVIEANTHHINKAYNHDGTQGRKDVWDKVQLGISNTLQDLRDKYPGVPIVISGDFNRAGSFGFPGFPNLDHVGAAGSGIDRFYTFGPVSYKSDTKFKTMSDHAAIRVTFELTAAVGTPKPPAAPKPTAPVPTKATGTKADPARPAVPKPATKKSGPASAAPQDIRRASTWRRRPEWRYFAQRMTGDGANGEIIHTDLPLADVEIEDMLTGHNALSATISPEFASLIASDGRPLLDEWGTAIWAEESGNIHGGGILTDSGFDGPKWGIDCVGLTGYLDRLPYSSATFFVEEDPLNIFRHIWAHAQSQPGGNVGLEIDNTYSGLQIGTALTQGEFDTQNGPLTFESGPYKLAWYQDHDLNEKAGSLAADTPFDWHEEHYWSGDTLHHRLKLGYPNLGVRRPDLRFVLGENIMAKPSVDRDGSEFADEVWALGAGEGSTIMRGVARKDVNRLRRVAVISDPSQRTQFGVNSLAARDLAWRNTLETISDVVVRDHPHADIGSIQVGDEINVQAQPGWVEIDAWYRVVSRRIKPQSADQMTLSLVRSDKLAS